MRKLVQNRNKQEKNCIVKMIPSLIDETKESAMSRLNYLLSISPSRDDQRFSSTIQN